jgi:hypothetical protein
MSECSGEQGGRGSCGQGGSSGRSGRNINYNNHPKIRKKKTLEDYQYYLGSARQASDYKSTTTP